MTRLILLRGVYRPLHLSEPQVATCDRREGDRWLPGFLASQEPGKPCSLVVLGVLIHVSAPHRSVSHGDSCLKRPRPSSAPGRFYTSQFTGPCPSRYVPGSSNSQWLCIPVLATYIYCLLSNHGTCQGYKMYYHLKKFQLQGKENKLSELWGEVAYFSKSFLKFLFYIGVQLTDNVVSVSAAQQWSSYTRTFTYSFSNSFLS